MATTGALISTAGRVCAVRGGVRPGQRAVSRPAPLGCRGPMLAAGGRRRTAVVLREAVSTDELSAGTTVEEKEPTEGEPKKESEQEVEQDKETVIASAKLAEPKSGPAATVASSNGAAAGNGAPANGASASANGNGAAPSSSGNGAAPKPDVARADAATAAPEVVKVSPPASSPAAPAAETVQASRGVTPDGGSAAPAASATLAEPVKPLDTIEEIIETELTMPDASAGRLETAAATTLVPPAKPAAAAVDQAQTPYENPGGKWNNFKDYGVWRRTLMVWTFAVQFAFKYALLNVKFTYGKEGMTKEAVSARKKELAIWLREGLVKLGPTFIKIGQQFSTRIDVLAPEFVKELEQLQDNVPPFDKRLAIATVERSLGKKISEVFEEFNPEPIAAASLGQVHLAKYKGENVVVKVQRPGLKDLFDIDLKNIRALAVWLEKVDPKTDGAARDWVAIYDECSRILYEEIDYRTEGKNADRFRENFKDVDWVKVPEVIWELSGKEVLVLEYCPGTKINNAERIDEMGLDRKRLARLSVESYLQQLLTHGFFHADPHPGNVAVDAVGGGRLIYYDFGMMGSLEGDVRGGLSGLFYGVYDNDPDKCLDALIKMGVLVPTGDATAVRRTAQFFLDAFKTRIAEQREQRKRDKESYESGFKEQRTKDESKTRRKQILAAIGEDLLETGKDQPFRFPAAFTFVVRSFTVLDGIGKSLDPRFDISEISAPYARELLLEAKPQAARAFNIFKKANANQNRAVKNLFKAPNAIEKVADTVQRMERGELKVRVRALETERALARAALRSEGLVAAVCACSLLNAFTTTVNAPGFVWKAAAAALAATGADAAAIAAAAESTKALTGAGYWAAAMLAGGVALGVLGLVKFLKVKKLEDKEAALRGSA